MKRVYWIMFCAMLWRHIQETESYSQDSLNSLIYDYVFKNMYIPRTGKLYDVSLPVDLSGMEVSVIRFRTHSLWQNGANFTSFEIPPRILPLPFTKRIDLVYQNLGNWSSSYYNVPNYTFLAPVIGLLAYDSDTSTRLVEVNLRGDKDNPIIVQFQNISLHVGMKCVRFSRNGALEFSNVIDESSCVARTQGHFSVVVPRISNKRNGVFKWWMMVILGGFVGLVLVLVLEIMVYKLFKWKSVRKMEKMSERSEGLGEIWIGNSRMPSASGIRTQPILENGYVP